MTSSGIDADLLAKVTGGDAALADELLQMLRAELPRHRREISDAVRDADFARVATLAHTLSGGAAYCGASDLKTASDALEAAANAAEKAHTSPLVERLTREMDRLLGAGG